MAAALRFSLRRQRLFCTQSSPTPTSTTTPQLITSEVKAQFRSEQNADKAIEMYKNLPTTNISPLASRFALGHTAKLLAKDGRFSDIKTLIDSHKHNPQINQVEYFAGLIRSYGIAGMLDEALNLFNQMGELGTPASCYTFNALLNAYKQAKKYDQVQKLFDEIPQRHDMNISPDSVSYGILIKSLCELGLSDSAITRLNEMEEKNLQNTIVYTTVLDALYKKGNVDKAIEIWEQMIEKGCLPDVSTYNVRIMHYSYKGKPQDVLGLFGEMKTAGLKPDTVSYNYLITCYFRNDMFEDGLECYEEIRKNGLSPNFATFKICLFHLCKNKHFKKGYEVWKESIKMGIFPTFPVLRMLVVGLAESPHDLKKEAAKEIITTMKEKSPQKLLEAWDKLEVELGLSKDGVSADAVSA